MEFIGVVNNAHAGLGFAPEVAKVVFPMSLFLVESDLTPLQEQFDEFVYGLTKWEPEITETGIFAPPKVMVTGKDYQEALTDMNHLFLQNMWGDGLPILPATEERVNWILTGTDLSPDTELGKFGPRGGIVTVGVLATALAMAGGRPEYLPVLIAAVEAMLNPVNKLASWQATSCSVFPVVISNGPIGKQIRLNSGFGLMGPNPVYPAGGSIGRAIRLIQQNVGGALPGVGTMAQFGGMRYTNAVFAEDEAGLPPGWEPLNVDRFGYPKGTNTVVVSQCSSVVNMWRRGAGKGETLEEEAIESLYRSVSFMGGINLNMIGGYEKSTPGIYIFSTANAIQMNEVGWTREKIREFLWENTKMPWSKVVAAGMHRSIGESVQSDPWPITRKPENFMIIVAGGRHPSHCYWMQTSMAKEVVIAEIKLPAKAKWDALLAQAEEDLGPIPVD